MGHYELELESIPVIEFRIEEPEMFGDMHSEIANQDCVWKNGVVLERDKTKAEVIEYYGRREIRIRIAGKKKRELMISVAHELDEIHSSYRRLKYSKLIPCNCERCINQPEPHFYKYEILQGFVERRQRNIQCQSSGIMVDVLDLLDTIGKGHFLEHIGTNRDSNTSQNLENRDDNTEEKDRDTTVIKNAWINGSFFLFAFAVIATGLVLLAKSVPFRVLPIILVSGVLLVLLIGVLLLRYNDRFSKKGFLKATQMVIKQLPLIKKFAGRSK